MTTIKGFFLFSLLFLSISINAQSLLDEENVWVMRTISMVSPSYTLSLLKIGQDSVMSDGFTYTNFENGIWNNSTSQLDWFENDEWLREDGEQVYSFGQGLIYDYSLEVGDTFDTDYCLLIVDSVESIELFNGEQRKQITLTSEGVLNPIRWIEGIGSSLGPFRYSPGICYTDYLLFLSCYAHDEEFLYANGSGIDGWEDCIDFTSSNQDVLEEKNSVNIYPNPIEDNWLNIENPTQQISTIRLFTIEGELLREWNGFDRNRVDVSDVPDGMFIIKLFNENNGVETFKILKR